MKEAKLRLKGVSKHFDEGGKRVDILEDVNAVVYNGELVSLLGKSGSGKTTLLNIISGIDSADEGEVLIGDTSLSDMTEEELTLFRRSRIGLVFQFFHLIPTLTVIENVTLPGELNGLARAESRRKAAGLLERVNLVERSNSYPDRLSGGEQQRVAIARALINDPDLILADEPTGNLDEDTAGEVLSLLLNLVRESGKTMIIATHSAEIKSFSDAVYTIHNGRLIPVSDDKDSRVLRT
ncbi:MAG: ABC transporter ATP-binding protein [Deltaproteobacteria bacterium]